MFFSFTSSLPFPVAVSLLSVPFSPSFSLPLFPSMLLSFFSLSPFFPLYVYIPEGSLNTKPYLRENTSKKQASPTATKVDTAMPAITAVLTLSLSYPIVRSHVGVAALVFNWYPSVQTHSKLPGVFLHSLFISSKQSCPPSWHSLSSPHVSPSCSRL